MNFVAARALLRRRPLLGWALALILPGMGYAVRVALGSTLEGYPYLTFFPVVVAIALLAGPHAAALSTFACALLAQDFAGTDKASVPGSISEWLGIGFYFAVCALIITLVELMNQAVVQATRQSQALALLNEELEFRVKERTAELRTSNAVLKSEIDARKAAEDVAARAQKMEAIGRLTGGIAHDFNNMLAVVIGNLDLAKRSLARGNVDVGRYLDGAIDAGRRGADLTQRLLAFARRQPLQPVVTDVNGLVRGMEELFRRTLGEDIALEVVLAGGLWQSRIDPSQLENALLNLAVNARDAMDGGGRLTVETMNTHLDDAYVLDHADVAAGQYVAIAVSDTGTGMCPEVISHASEPFFTTKDPGKGTGLGLSQVYGFVKQSGGHVKIYSEFGCGTTVKIYLPREINVQAIAGNRSRAPEVWVPEGSPDEVVLVVEDEPAVRKTTVAALCELGYTVQDAESGAQALRVLAGHPGVDLLFTDVVMPGMSGRELADAVTRRYPGIRVLYTTGYTPNAIVHSGVVDQGVALITKPFTVDQLARKVRKVLSATA